ncbi:hypothetical protein GRI33_11440 [Brucella sp. BO3]|uniref:hypothetical protein n=1 Tax=unclassified Brucella TaxID=2632610 RepID=UPI00084FA7FA|nr:MULTISPECIES: hypothetical protein [unclassified Brucella]OEI83065.1 hypothetical protein BA060_08295 [Brucella sp. B13-0095]QMV27592.1 hypothetical protein GRI33_11440 [Brucella sp. BO3]
MYHFRFSTGCKALPTAVPHRGTLVGSIAVATYLILFALVVLFVVPASQANGPLDGDTQWQGAQAGGK